jgi:K+-transporting ATPase ATPase A chain
VTLLDYLVFFVFICTLIIFSWPLGKYISYLYSKEEFIFKSYCLFFGTTKKNLSLGESVKSILGLSFISLFAVIALAVTQSSHMWNFNNAPSMDFATAFNLATSFFTGTNIQITNPETTVSFITNTLGLTVQNFIAPGLGIAVMMLIIKAYNYNSSEADKKMIGNVLVDTYAAIIFILLPLCFITAIIYLASGTPQNLEYGFAASQEAAKQVGTNGGGIYFSSSASPLATPNLFSLVFQLVLIPLLATSLCFTFGNSIKQVRVGFALLFLMMLLYIPQALLCLNYESYEPAFFQSIGLSGPFMEGKQVQFGTFFSTLWATLSSATSNGSTISALSSYQPSTLLLLQNYIALGEISLGGVGTNIVNLILLMKIITFLSALTTGRNPVLFGKSISFKEVRTASLCVLLPLIIILASIYFLFQGNILYSVNTITSNYITEVIYLILSCTFGNGSYMSGLNPNNYIVNIFMGLVMLLGRFIVIFGGLFLAYQIYPKEKIKADFVKVDSLMFIIFSSSIIFMLGPLTLLPAFSFGSLAGLLFYGT